MASLIFEGFKTGNQKDETEVSLGTISVILSTLTSKTRQFFESQILGTKLTIPLSAVIGSEFYLTRRRAT